MPPPLAGFTVAVTADRRREELCALLERRGARVVQAPAVRIIPLPDDTACLEATRRCLRAPLDFVVATTGVGFRGWLSAADGWGLARPLLGRISAARVMARGPKARGAIRAAGLTEEWSPASECAAEVLSHLLEIGVAGLRVAVQLHGDPQPDLVSGLREAGAEVIEVPVYRWAPPVDMDPLRRLVDLVTTRQVDAVTFTSAPAVTSLLDTDPSGEVLSALRDDVLAACVGPVCAAPLQRLGVPTAQPARGRLGALVRTVVDELSGRRSQPLRVAGHTLAVRGHAVILDGELVQPPPAPMALLRALARRPGRVLSRAELLRELPRGADGHAVEMAVARLRGALGDPQIVQTVVKRGYRLRVDHANGEPAGRTCGSTWRTWTSSART
ncbi:MAG: uroporphyrinogen-III synthase [Micromonosporaceae bacterium]|nr:uroporphyrinogen-III synthase [Micromonosporaceae bacterium]